MRYNANAKLSATNEKVSTVDNSADTLNTNQRRGNSVTASKMLATSTAVVQQTRFSWTPTAKMNGTGKIPSDGEYDPNHALFKYARESPEHTPTREYVIDDKSGNEPGALRSAFGKLPGYVQVAILGAAALEISYELMFAKKVQEQIAE